MHRSQSKSIEVDRIVVMLYEKIEETHLNKAIIAGDVEAALTMLLAWDSGGNEPPTDPTHIALTALKHGLAQMARKVLRSWPKKINWKFLIGAALLTLHSLPAAYWLKQEYQLARPLTSWEECNVCVRAAHAASVHAIKNNDALALQLSRKMCELYGKELDLPHHLLTSPLRASADMLWQLARHQGMLISGGAREFLVTVSDFGSGRFTLPYDFNRTEVAMAKLLLRSPRS